MADDPKNQPAGANPQASPAAQSNAPAPRGAASNQANRPGEKAADSAAPAEFTPYKAPGEMKVPGGLYRRGTRLEGGRHFGGDIANADGVAYATFGPGRENTGHPADGDLTAAGEDFLKAHGDKLDD